jgi:hypothetical protein
MSTENRAKEIQAATGLPYVACLAQAKKEHRMDQQLAGKLPRKKYAKVWEGGQQVAHEVPKGR